MHVLEARWHMLTCMYYMQVEAHWHTMQLAADGPSALNASMHYTTTALLTADRMVQGAHVAANRIYGAQQMTCALLLVQMVENAQTAGNYGHQDIGAQHAQEWLPCDLLAALKPSGA